MAKIATLSEYEKAVVISYLRTLADRYDEYSGEIWATAEDKKVSKAIHRTLAIVKESDELSKSPSMTNGLPEEMATAIWKFDIGKNTTSE